jgi:DNA adenine methylase
LGKINWDLPDRVLHRVWGVSRQTLRQRRARTGIGPARFDANEWLEDPEFIRAIVREQRRAARDCGSKASLVPQILSHLPSHQLYVETHAGSAAVLLGKPTSRIEVMNDKDDALVNFFRVLRERRDDLLRLLRLTPYALTEWRRCRATLADPDADGLELARRFYVSVCQSFAGFGEKFNRSTHKPHAIYWRDRMERLDEVADRLRTVVIEALDATECIAKYDSAKTVFFVDPPYVRSSRSKLGPAYRCDMTDADHLCLLKALQRIKGKVLLAGGESALYAEHLRDWRLCYRHRLPCGTGGSKVGRYSTPYRVEMLWANF